MIKSLYFQFVNFIQEMHTGWFLVICGALFIGVLLSVMKFFKSYNGEQKRFEKISLIIIAILLFAVLVYLSYIRK